MAKKLHIASCSAISVGEHKESLCSQAKLLNLHLRLILINMHHKCCRTQVIPVFTRENIKLTFALNFKTLYNKQFGFQKKCSTDKAILLTSSRQNFYQSFHKNSCALETHKYYVISSYHKWLTNYLTNCKQYVFYDDKSTLTVLCGVRYVS